MCPYFSAWRRTTIMICLILPKVGPSRSSMNGRRRCMRAPGPINILVKRFGFHNLRHSLSNALITGEKEDPRTVQDSNSSTTPELYTQSTMSQPVAAQQKLLSRIVPQNELIN